MALAMKRDYSIKRKGIWYSRIKETIVKDKEDNCIYFPSFAEYNLFIELKKALRGYEGQISLQVHPKLKTSVVCWVLDFKLTAHTSGAAKCLARLTNYYNGSEFHALKTVWIEYKGFADSNFRTKIRTTLINLPNIGDTILVLSNREDCYSFTKGKEKFHKKISDVVDFIKTLGVIIKSLH